MRNVAAHQRAHDRVGHQARLVRQEGQLQQRVQVRAGEVIDGLAEIDAPEARRRQAQQREAADRSRRAAQAPQRDPEAGLRAPRKQQSQQR